MRRFWSELHPTLRGFLIIGLIALVVVVLNLQNTVNSLLLIAAIAFPLAIAFFVYLVWRQKRDDIAVWPARVRFAFYGGAALIVVALLAFFFKGASGVDAIGFLLTIGLAAFAMWRAWRDQHTYGY